MPSILACFAVVLSWLGDYDEVMLNWSDCPVVESKAQKLGGTWVFKDTRVPVATLFEYLRDGFKVDDFTEYFTSVSREQVDRVLEHTVKSLERPEIV